MMSWLWQSSLLLTLILTPLLLLHPWLLNRLGARSCYLLWSAAPVTLLLPLLPSVNWQQSASPQLIETLLVSAHQLQHSVQATNMVDSLLWLWLLGVILAVAYCAISLYLLHRQLRQGRRIQRSQLRCYISQHHLGPAIFGLLRPNLIIPADFQQRFSRDQRRLILQHELAHWQRGDLHANLLALLLLCLFWFHPLLWLAYRRYRADQELACDADVLKRYPNSTPFCYAKALLAAMQSVPNSAAPIQPFCHQYGASHMMKERLQQLKQQHGFSKMPSLMIIATLVTGSLLWQSPLEATQLTNTVAKASPIVRIEPRYPQEAAQKRIEGFVKLQFDVDADGKTQNIRVIEAQPEKVFEKESVRALERWRYQPSSDAAGNQDLQIQLTFALDPLPAQDTEQQ